MTVVSDPKPPVSAAPSTAPAAAVDHAAYPAAAAAPSASPAAVDPAAGGLAAPASAAAPLMTVTGLGFRYSRLRPWLFRDLGFELERGEILSILGPNARGKTTLLKCLSGLLTLREGQISCGTAVGYVPQDHGAGGTSFSVAEMVLMGRSRHLRAYQTPRREDHDAADAAMERVGVAAWANRSYAELSGGQRQLVLIARALASGSELLILDEPASALDLHNQSRVLTVLAGLAADGMGVIMTTHHPDHALHVSRNALLFVGSDDTRWGPTEDLLTGSALSAVYGLPICTPTVGTVSGDRVIAVPDFGPSCRGDCPVPARSGTALPSNFSAALPFRKDLP